MAKVLNHKGEEEVVRSLHAKAWPNPPVAHASAEVAVRAGHADEIGRSQQLREMHDPARASDDSDYRGDDIAGPNVFQVSLGLALRRFVFDCGSDAAWVRQRCVGGASEVGKVWVGRGRWWPWCAMVWCA